MYYIGDNDNEYRLKYGDEVEVTPLKENNTDGEYFGVYIYDKKKHVGYETMMSLSELINSFTLYDFEVSQDQVPKKPYEDNGNMVCPNCMEVVTDDFSQCENCGQTLDWGEYGD